MERYLFLFGYGAELYHTSGFGFSGFARRLAPDAEKKHNPDGEESERYRLRNGERPHRRAGIATQVLHRETYDGVSHEVKSRRSAGESAVKEEQSEKQHEIRRRLEELRGQHGQAFPCRGRDLSRVQLLVPGGGSARKRYGRRAIAPLSIAATVEEASDSPEGVAKRYILQIFL